MPTQQDWMEAQKQRMAPQTPDTIGRMLMGMEHPGSGGNAELTAGDYTLRQRLADILAKVYGGNDPRAAQSFGRSGADLASIAPGSGQILSGDDAIRAAGKGDVSGAALAGLGAIPGAGPEARAAAEGGDALTNAMRQIKNLKGEMIDAPRSFFRGTNPGDERRIKTGAETWDSHLFAADNADAASFYGSNIQKLEASPDAKILYEGTPEWNKVAGKIRKDENLLQYSDRAAQAAKAAGYDAAWFQRQGDVGTAIFNPGKFTSPAAEGGDALTNAMRQLELPLPHTPQPPRGFQAWHGSPDPNLDRISSRHAVEARGATFHASNPDVAEMFTTPREYGEPVWDAPPGKVYQTQLDPRYPFEVPSHEAQKFIDDTAHQQRVIDEAMRKGHDMVIARNVKEGFGGEAIPTDVYAALRDEIIKMRR